MGNVKGFSLVELMIAMLIGLVLMTGVVQLFLSSRAGFNSQQGIARVQETGRLALEFMAKDIRMAGYYGCNSSDITKVTSTLNNQGNYSNQFDVGVQGFTIAGTPVTLGAAIKPKLNTDAFVLTSAANTSVTVTKDNSSATLFGSLNKTEVGACNYMGKSSDRLDGICEGDILMVTDCAKTKIFQSTLVNNASGEIHIDHSGNNTYTPGNAISSWGGNGVKNDDDFGPGSQIIKVSRITYYIKDRTDGTPCLYQNIDGVDIELLENIEDMIVTYGIDKDAADGQDSPTDYLYASQLSAADWNSVKSLRVRILVASAETNVLSEPQTYQFEPPPAAATKAKDRKLRQVFIDTVGIRSRIR